MTQKNINILNFTIAAVALLLSLPSVINQYNQLVKEKNEPGNTETVYFSPDDYSVGSTKQASSCNPSLLSQRLDAARCFGEDSKVYDPCFQDQSLELKYSQYFKQFNCPKSWNTTTENTTLLVANDKYTKPSISTKEQVTPQPWLLVLKDGTECRATSGATGPAYDNKGNNYGCNNKLYAAVTGGKITNGKYYAECKLQQESIFKACYVAKIVY
jgi:hypothetical protein